MVVVWGDAGGWVGGMDTSCLFTAALQLRGPWKVGSVDFRDAGDGGRGLHIMIGFEPGVRFHCPETGCRGGACPVHDTRERVWRHLNFFQYVLLQCLFDRFGSVFPQCGLMVFPGVVIVSR